jgi:sulfonate transport system ATP-binding protein
MAIVVDQAPAGQAPAGLAVLAAGVTRGFQPGRGVLCGLDLSIAPGEFVALLGRSGAGKSTLLRILGGLDPEYGGDVLVPERRAVVFQEPRLIPWLKVLPNVTLGLRPGPAGLPAAAHPLAGGTRRGRARRRPVRGHRYCVDVQAGDGRRLGPCLNR